MAALRAKYGLKNNEFNFQMASAILKDRFSGDDIPLSLYSRFMFFLGDTSEGYITEALKHHGIPPRNLTARADFAAAAYWHDRKLGPPPEKYVAKRHAARPYT